ncbi:hypothetical protein BDV97DRAFT_400740 [Delphinella strobiligena]|nr:hypothetical protein BDV97DRAFT_400740 [Delphinella strobiligena]
MAQAQFSRSDAFRSSPSEHERSELKSLKQTLRRRDNLEDFIDGVIETEMFPYPGGMREVVPATYVPVQEITWKAGAFEQLTTTTITAVKYMLDGVDRHVNVTMTLTPYDGIGTYEMEYDMIKETTEDTTWSQADLETVRMAMWARYEWVKEKVEYINHLRWEAGLQSAEQAADDEFSVNTSEDHMLADISEDDMSADTSEEDEGEAASEEDDPYDCECSSDDGMGVEDANNDPVVFPDAKKLKAMDLTLLRQLFEKKELESLHNTIKGQHESFKLAEDIPQSTIKRSKRKGQEMTTTDRERSRKEMVESVRDSFLEVAKSLPSVDSTDEQVRVFREVVGGLHLAARLLELDGNLRHVNMPEEDGSATLGLSTNSREEDLIDYSDEELQTTKSEHGLEDGLED